MIALARTMVSQIKPDLDTGSVVLTLFFSGAGLFLSLAVAITGQEQLSIGQNRVLLVYKA